MRQVLIFFQLIQICATSFAQHAPVMLSRHTTIFTGPLPLSNGEKAAASILSDEVGKRTGFKWEQSSRWPDTGDIIMLKRTPSATIPPLLFPGLPALPSRPESFRIGTAADQHRTIILIEGSDNRGLLYGAGKLLRMMQFNSNTSSSPALAVPPALP